MHSPSIDTPPLGSGSPLAKRLQDRERKVNKACIPCRARKVKCDSAVVGLPCSGCTSRQCAEDCMVQTRKRRTTKVRDVLLTPANSTGAAHRSKSSEPYRLRRIRQDRQTSNPNDFGHESPRQAESDLLYLNILDDAVRDSDGHIQHPSTSQTPGLAKPEDGECPRARLPRLNDIDHEYLMKKGALDLPPPQILDALVTIYFDHVYPIVPVISKADFIDDYQAGNCSLFVLRAILTTATAHVPAEVLSECGFTSRSAAQETFFSKAKLIHDVASEEDPLMMLQGSITLCMVILDHPADRDFGYWFHNAIRLAGKIDLLSRCAREDTPRKLQKLFRRIWWTLYALDIFHVLTNTRRTRLLEDSPIIEPRSEDDWESEDDTGALSGILSPLTPQQKASPVLHCDLSRIFGQCLPSVTGRPQQSPRETMYSLDAWRKSLAEKMPISGGVESNKSQLHIQALSYRYECIFCRLIQRRWQRSRDSDLIPWASKRLRDAMLELDTVAMRVLAAGTLHEFPIPFVTTMTALLALHIEMTLDKSSTDLIRSRAKVSISQTMLLLTQGKDIPVLKRALPIFEEILTKSNLHSFYSSSPDQTPAHVSSQDKDMANAYASPRTQVGGVSPEWEQWENNSSWNVDFLGFDFLDDWQQTGSFDFSF